MGLFKDALSFPFKPFKRLWWFWINGIPIIGWIIYSGYAADIVRNIADGKEEMPPMGKLWPTVKVGFIYLVISAIFATIGELFLWIPKIGWLFWLIVLLLMPILLIQYAITRRFKDGFDVVSAAKIVFKNFFKYVLYNLAIIVVTLIWAVATLPMITLLITLPALMLSSLYILARFYREVQPKAHLYTHAHHKRR